MSIFNYWGQSIRTLRGPRRVTLLEDKQKMGEKSLATARALSSHTFPFTQKKRELMTFVEKEIKELVINPLRLNKEAGSVKKGRQG
jgi:hypothetical protein